MFSSLNDLLSDVSPPQSKDNPFVITDLCIDLLHLHSHCYGAKLFFTLNALLNTDDGRNFSLPSTSFSQLLMTQNAVKFDSTSITAMFLKGNCKKGFAEKLLKPLNGGALISMYSVKPL